MGSPATIELQPEKQHEQHAHGESVSLRYGGQAGKCYSKKSVGSCSLGKVINVSPGSPVVPCDEARHAWIISARGGMEITGDVKIPIGTEYQIFRLIQTAIGNKSCEQSAAEAHHSAGQILREVRR